VPVIAPHGPYVPTQHAVPFETGGHKLATHGVMAPLPPLPIPLTAPLFIGTPATPATPAPFPVA
jgi:hypothetical protein